MVWNHNRAVTKVLTSFGSMRYKVEIDDSGVRDTVNSLGVIAMAAELIALGFVLCAFSWLSHPFRLFYQKFYTRPKLKKGRIKAEFIVIIHI